MLATHQVLVDGNEMASAHLPKQGFSSEGSDGTSFIILELSPFELLSSCLKPFLAYSRKSLQVSCILFLSLGMLDLDLNRACGAGFKVEGIFEQNINNSDRIETLAKGSFSLVVDDCKWRIRTKQFNNDYAVDYVEAGSTDRHQIYLLASHTNLTQEALRTVSTPLDVGFAEIIPGEVPHFNTAEEICVLWLAYASGCYFESQTNNLIEPVFWFGGRYFFNRGLTLPGIWETKQEPPHLPSRVVYFNDGFFRGIDHEGSPKVFPNPAPVYREGYTNAIYEGFHFVDLGQYTIPSDFELRIYRTKRDAKSPSDLALNRTFTIKATNYSLLNSPESFVPVLNGSTSVKDYRLAVRDGLTKYVYTLTNEWITAEAVTRGRSPEHVVVGMKTQGTAANTNTKFVKITFAAMLVLSVVILPFLLTKAKHQT